METDSRGRKRVVRTVYEACVFQALRDRLRCKEIWVVGAHEWRNPDEDLPADFEANRAEHYEMLHKPLDAGVFVAELREELRRELVALDEALPGLDWLEITDRKGGAIRLSPVAAQPEPANLRRLKRAVQARWGTVPLIDMLKEAALRTGMLAQLTPVGTREASNEALCGNGCCSSPTPTAPTPASGPWPRPTTATARPTSATSPAGTSPSKAPVPSLSSWPTPPSPPASGRSGAKAPPRSPPTRRHFRSYDQNLFTEWHSRYGGRGVLIYWHVEKKSMVVHSQLLSCTASEVAAMVEGAVRHGTSMQLEGNYVDSHGQSEIGFAITRLLGFDLLPRIKQINKVKLYRPTDQRSFPAAGAGDDPGDPMGPDRAELRPDDQVRYRHPGRDRLNRGRPAPLHPQRFPPRLPGHARSRPCAEDHLRLPVPPRPRPPIARSKKVSTSSESWNRVNAVIFFGKSGEFATNRRDQQELGMLALHILQAAMVYVNTLMVQDVLAEPEWADALTAADKRGLTPLFWSHVLPYGEVKLNMTKRLALSGPAAPTSDGRAP